MKQQHHPWQTKAFLNGANTDSEKEIPAQDEDGSYVDSRNARLMGGNGHNSSLEKIKGEELKYPANFSVGDYYCIYTCNVNDDIIDIWADKQFIEDPLIRVNGVVVAKSPKLGFRSDRPLQGDTNDSCVGGEFFVTDFEQPPFIFNVKDLVDSLTANPTKYFSGFNPSIYQTTLPVPLDIPVFKGLVNLGGGGGLPPGDYAYSIRYVNALGDRTNFSMETPTISVLSGYSSDSAEYPYTKTYGAAANPSFKTAYGIRLKFRVTNLGNYSYIEVRRVAYNQGAGLTFVPSPKIIAKIPITPGQISIEEFIDPQDSMDPVLDISQDEDEQVFSTVQACKTLRYYNKRLVLMNLRYPSRDVGNVKFIEDTDGTSGFPIITPLGTGTHYDWNYAYLKNMMSGERYKHGIVVLDGSGGSSFVVEMNATQMKDFYTVPNHRDPLSLKALNFCVTKGPGAPYLNDVTNNKSYVYEIWDMHDCLQKFDSTTKNIISQNAPGVPSPIYGVFTPIGDADPDVTGHRYWINSACRGPGGTYQSYNPKGFAPQFWTRGIAMNGVKKNTLPTWARAFSYVRTKRAKRAICQGIGIYRMNPAVKTSTGIGYTSGVTKDLTKLTFFSPDIFHGFVDAATVADMQANPGNYSVQLLSPVGYFSEMYSALQAHPLTPKRDQGVDLITYARVQEEDGSINPSETSGQVKYGQYLNPTPVTSAATVGPDYGNYKFKLTEFTTVTEGRGTYYTLGLNQPIYGFGSQGGSGSHGWDIDEGKDFREPFYIVNIIHDGAEPPKGNIVNYTHYGHYQKLVSIIGKSNGLSGTYELVDERWEDCIPNQYDPAVANINTYLNIQDTSGLDHKWLNVTYKSPATIATILNAINIFGFYNDGFYNIEGVYTSGNSGHTYWVTFNVVDPNFPVQLQIPANGSLIKTEYDERFPIRVYPGEHYVGESIFAPIDRQSPCDGCSEPDENNEFLFGSGMPYHGYEFNGTYAIPLKTYGAGFSYWNAITSVPLGGSMRFNLDYIRQWVVMFPTESLACLPMNWDDFFPHKHYVMRPYKYSIGTNMASSNPHMYPQYFSDYPNEENYWGYGGFHFFPANNPDYSVSLNDRGYVSKPLVGFVEQTDFCSRIIWSLERGINVQDSPGLRTFPSTNVKDISDNQGCIKYAYDANTAKGSNLYALCSRGICLLVTNKILLNDANANQLAYAKTENFINDEYWVTKDVGISDEFWRSVAETSSAVFGESRVDAAFFVNKESSYVFVDNNVIDIAKKKYGYHKRIYNEVSKVVKPDYATQLCAVYDRTHEEYWVHINTQNTSDIVIENNTTIHASFSKETGKILLLNGSNVNINNNTTGYLIFPTELPTGTYSINICNSGTATEVIKNELNVVLYSLAPGYCVKMTKTDTGYTFDQTPNSQEDGNVVVKKTFVFNQPNQKWTGYFDYAYDKFLSKYDKVFGMRDLQTNILNEGYVINGGNIRFEADQSHAPESAAAKEFVRIRINSSKKPTRVEFFLEQDSAAQSWLDSSNPLYLKDYNGFEQYIPRTDSSVDITSKRIQGRVVYYKIIHDLPEDFRLIDSSVQYKKLK